MVEFAVRESDPQSKPVQEHKQLFPVRVLALVLVLFPVSLCGIALTFVIWRTHLRHVTHDRLHAIKASGLPISGKELNDYYPAVPDAQNAALVMTQAFALMRIYPDERSNKVEELSFPLRGQHLNPDEPKLRVGYVEMNSNAIEMARVAVQTSLPV